MRHFIYFRNQDYAKILAKKFNNSFIKETQFEINGVDALDGDVFIIDAHFGQGEMAELCGLKIAHDLVKKNDNQNITVKVYSWFFKEYMDSLPIIKEINSYKTKVEFIQLPKIINNL